jgi:hypothetical protein
VCILWIRRLLPDRSCLVRIPGATFTVEVYLGTERSAQKVAKNRTKHTPRALFHGFQAMSSPICHQSYMVSVMHLDPWKPHAEKIFGSLMQERAPKPPWIVLLQFSRFPCTGHWIPVTRPILEVWRYDPGSRSEVSLHRVPGQSTVEAT